jgi:hypothetical protein
MIYSNHPRQVKSIYLVYGSSFFDFQSNLAPIWAAPSLRMCLL